MTSSSAVVATKLLRKKVAAAVAGGSGSKLISNNNNATTIQNKRHNSNSNNNNNLKNILKHGIGRITATATTTATTLVDHNNDTNTKKTNLTRLSHKSPTRLLPLHNKSSIKQSSGTIVAISNYGGGMLHNDISTIHIECNKNASLGIITQGSNRIYKQKKQKNNDDNDCCCYTNLHATIEDNGLLVIAPDPTVLFATSSLRQSQTIQLLSSSSSSKSNESSSCSSSSLALVDWFSSGRYRNGECWQFHNLQSTTRLLINNNELFLQDSTKMDLRINNNSRTNSASSSSSSSDVEDKEGEDLQMVNSDPFIGINTNTNTNNNNGANNNIHTFVSLILFGNQVDTVQNRCWELQDLLVQQKTRIRKRSSTTTSGVVVESSSSSSSSTHNDDNDDDDDDAQKKILLDSLAGDFYLGISPVDIPITTTTTTTTNSKSDSKSSKSKQQQQQQQQAHVIRMAATTNEDVYRILNYCLQPLSSKFGYEFYKDRIRACKSEIPKTTKITTSSTTSLTRNGNNNATNQKLDHRSSAAATTTTNGVDNTTTTHNKNLDMLWEQYYQQIIKYDYQTEESHKNNTNLKLWSTYILGDSSFPIGSFAHSSGLESAVQLGIIKSTKDLERFIQATIRSTLQMTVPYILEGHRLLVDEEFTTTTTSTTTTFEIQWKQLNKHAQAVLCCNAIACSASLDQGKSLSRVVQRWLLEEENDDNSETQQQQQQQRQKQKQKQLVLQCLRQDSSSSSSANNDYCHFGPTFGIVTKLFHLTPKQACELYGYTIGRDIVSAAVRMNLIGPIKSVSMLDKLRSSVEIGIEASLTSILHEHEQKQQNGNADDDDESLLFNAASAASASAAGTSAPILEAIHPCHEILQTRLFRS